jgi:hypothetical protein
VLIHIVFLLKVTRRVVVIYKGSTRRWVGVLISGFFRIIVVRVGVVVVAVRRRMVRVMKVVFRRRIISIRILKVMG